MEALRRPLLVPDAGRLGRVAGASPPQKHDEGQEGDASEGDGGPALHASFLREMTTARGADC